MNDYNLFYKENKDRLYAYLLRMTGERQLALDLVQESFVRYLGRYGRHEFSKALTVLDIENYQDPGADPEQQIIDQQKFKKAISAIAKLALLDRELISLVTTTDLNYKEIGRVLKISEANVKVRIHRARTKLREMLASGGE